MDLQGRVHLLELQGVLDGHGTADAAAVGPLRRPGAHALDHHDPPQGTGVHCSACHLLLQLPLGEDAGIFAVEILLGLVFLPACGHDGDPVLQLPVGHGRGDHDTGGEIPHGPCVVHYLGIGDHLDGIMLMHLSDQRLQIRLGVFSAQGIGEVSQLSTQLRLLFHQKYLKSLFGQPQGRRHPGHPPADHQSPLFDGKALHRQRLQHAGVGHGNPHQILGLFRGLLGMVHVDPRALVADVGHPEEIGVESFFPQGLAKERLMGPGRTGGDDDPVEPLLLYHLSDPLLRVLGTGEEVVLGIDHMRERLDVLPYRRHIHHRPDVDPAVTDKDPDPRFLPAHIPLRGICLLLEECAPARGDGLRREGRGPACLGHGLGYVLGTLKGAADVDPLPGRGDRRRRGRGAEAVRFQLNPQLCGQLTRSRGGPQAHREDHHMKHLVLQRPVLIHVGDHQVLALRVLRYPGDHGADVPDPMLLAGPLVVGIKPLAEGPDVYVEDGGLDDRDMLFGNDGLFGGIHTADRRTVVVLMVPGSHALDEGDFLRYVAVRGTHHRAVKGAGGAQHPLELDARHHIGIPAVAVFPPLARIILVESRGENHRAYLELHDRILLGVVDGLGLTHLQTDAAAEALAAVEAPLGLGDCFFFCESGLNLLKGPGPLRRGKRGAPLAPLVGDPRRHILDDKAIRLLPPRREVHAPEVAVDGEGRPLPPGDGLNGDPRPRLCITPGVDPGERGGAGQGVNLDGPPRGDPDLFLCWVKGHDDLLPDGGDEQIDGHGELGTLGRQGPPAPRGIRLPQPHPNQLQSGDPPVLDHDPGGGRQETDIHPLFQGGRYLLGTGGHLPSGTAIQDGRLLGPHPEGAAGRINGHVPAADDCHLSVDLGLVAEIEITQEIDPWIDPLGVLSRDPELHALMGPHAEKDGLVPQLPEEVGKGDILPDAGIGPNLHAEIEDGLQLPVQDIPRQAIVGDADAQHAPQRGEGLEDRHPIAQPRQVVGARQPCRPSPDHGHGFCMLRLKRFLGTALPVPLLPIGHKPLQGADGKGLIDLGPPQTLLLAGMRADPPDDPRKGELLPDDLQGPGVLAGSDGPHIFPHIEMDGTPRGTGGVPPVDHMRRGDGLGVIDVDGLAAGQPLVVFTAYLQRTILMAYSTAGTLRRVHPLGMTQDGGPKGPGLSLQPQQLGKGDELDVGVAPHLYELG